MANMTPMRIAASNIARWRKDPVAFVREEFGVEPDAWQADFLHDYNGNPRVAAKACKGPGKTTVLAWCMWHFLVCYAHSKVVATSISGANLKDGLWSELAKWQQRSEFLKAAFTWRAERIVNNDHPETWFMSARQWSQSANKEQQANTLAGLHADFIMFVIDEAGGVPDAVMAAAEAALANAGTEVNPNAIAKLLIAGNPTHLNGPLYRACTTEASQWKVIEITGDPDSPKRSPRINIDWARKQIKAWGADNSWVLVNVFGKFPPSSINALLGPDDVEAAMKRVIAPTAYNRSAKILGVDVALQGDDRTVIAPRQGLVAFKPKVLRLAEPKLIAGQVATAIKTFDPDGVFIDNTGGWGSGVISWLTDWGYNVTPVGFAEKAMNDRYANKRSEIHHELAYWTKGGGCLPDIPELKEELCAQTYTHKKDKLIMTEKDQIKEIIHRSPDLADAYALTFSYPVAKRDPLAAQKAQDAVNYDPIRQNYGDYNPTSQQKVDDYNPLG